MNNSNSQAVIHRPETVAEATSLLAQAGDGGRALSGGASLVAMMNARLVLPTCIVSLARIKELRECQREADGSVRIGAMRNHRQTASETDLQGSQQVVASAAAQIANPPVRNMGTIGGSVGLADPAADYPPALMAANAELEIAGPDGRRRLPVSDYFLGWYETALTAGEIVTAVLLPAPDTGSVGHYEKLCRVTGDFAVASVAVTLTPGADSTVTQVRIAVGGCGGGPIRDEAAEACLIGQPLDEKSIQQAGTILQAALDPVDDVRGSAQYRRQVVPRLLRRVLSRYSTGLEPVS